MFFAVKTQAANTLTHLFLSFTPFLQRKFREAESEDSYFNDEDDDEEIGPLPHEQRAPLQAMSETTSLLADVASLE